MSDYLKEMFGEINAVLERNMDVILQDPSTANAIKTICISLEALQNCLVNVSFDENTLRVLSRLGLRIHNSCQVCLQLALSGYYQGSLMVMRDVVETMFLFQYLNYKRDLIDEWSKADTKIRRNKFSPEIIRKCLHEMDGHGSEVKTRLNHYNDLNELGVHPSGNSFMMHQRNHETLIGPFCDEAKLESCLNYLAMHVTEATGSVMQVVKPTDDNMLSRIKFRDQVQEWYKSTPINFSESEIQEFSLSIHIRD